MLDKQRVEDILTDRPGNYYSQANAKERQIFRDWITGVLRRETVTVDFEKTNGELRSMACTLQESQLPPAVNKTTQKKVNPEVCVVWDCHQQAWRSFRWDRIKKLSWTME